MVDRNRELVAGSRSLAVVRERALNSVQKDGNRYSEYSGGCRKVELPGRSVEVKV